MQGCSNGVWDENQRSGQSRFKDQGHVVPDVSNTKTQEASKSEMSLKKTT